MSYKQCINTVHWELELQTVVNALNGPRDPNRCTTSSNIIYTTVGMSRAVIGSQNW